MAPAKQTANNKQIRGSVSKFSGIAATIGHLMNAPPCWVVPKLRNTILARIDLLHTHKIDLSCIQITILAFAESTSVYGSRAVRFAAQKPMFAMGAGTAFEVPSGNWTWVQLDTALGSRDTNETNAMTSDIL